MSSSTILESEGYETKNEQIHVQTSSSMSCLLVALGSPSLWKTVFSLKNNVVRLL